MAVSNIVTFANPNAPVYPRLAQGRTWNEVSLTLVTLLQILCILYEKGRRKPWIGADHSLMPCEFLDGEGSSFPWPSNLNSIYPFLGFYKLRRWYSLTWNSDDSDMDKWIWDRWSRTFCWMGSQRKGTSFPSGNTDFWSQQYVWYVIKYMSINTVESDVYSAFLSMEWWILITLWRQHLHYDSSGTFCTE